MLAELELAAHAARDAGVGHFADCATRAAAERDFGAIARGRCLLVAEPTSAESCSRLVRELARNKLGCTLRGSGYGQSGQSVALDTVSLSTRRLDAIGPVDRDARAITVGAGASMRRVLLALRDVGLVPPVLPLNLDMSLGGLLSAGGAGSSSHRHGFVASNVLELEVVTGDGELHRCSESSERELFDAVLGGLGQCGLITQAKLALVPAPKRMRVLSFLYDDPAPWLEDQQMLMDAGVELHLEGFCWAAAKGVRSTFAGPLPFTHWMYGLHVAIPTESLSDAAVTGRLASLRAARKLDEHEVEHVAFLHRYETRFSGMVQSGAWNAPHPWFEGMIPAERTADTLRRILDVVPAEAGDGHRLTWVDTRRTPSSFAKPAGDRCALLGIFPVSFADAALPKMLERMDQITSLLLEVGGKRYLSGWLGSNPSSYLRAHFGPRYEAWMAMRRRYDPDATFRSRLFPRGHHA